MTTGAGFVSFSTFIPLILRNHINFFWRWVTIPPVSSLCILCLSTWKIQWQKRCLHRGLQGKERVRVRGRESQGERHRDRERGGIETDWFPPPAASVQSQPADFRGSAGPGMSPAGPSCLSAGRTSPGGPGTVRRHQKNNYADRRESCARSQTRTTSSVTGKITPCTVSMTWLIIHRSSKMIDWDEINNRNRYPFFKSK